MFSKIKASTLSSSSPSSLKSPSMRQQPQQYPQLNSLYNFVNDPKLASVARAAGDAEAANLVNRDPCFQSGHKHYYHDRRTGRLFRPYRCFLPKNANRKWSRKKMIAQQGLNCSASFSSYCQAVKHMRREHHMEDLSTKKYRKLLRQTALSSSSSPSPSSSAAAVAATSTSALWLHTAFEPYQCSRCGTGYRRPERLREHERLICRQFSKIENNEHDELVTLEPMLAKVQQPPPAPLNNVEDSRLFHGMISTMLQRLLLGNFSYDFTRLLDVVYRLVHQEDFRRALYARLEPPKDGGTFYQPFKALSAYPVLLFKLAPKEKEEKKSSGQHQMWENGEKYATFSRPLRCHVAFRPPSHMIILSDSSKLPTPCSPSFATPECTTERRAPAFFAAFPGPFSNCWLTEYADEEYTKFAFEQFWTALPANYISVRFSANALGAMALAYDADDYGISRAELTGAISAEASQELFTSWSQQLFTQIRPLAGVSERHLQAYWIQDSSDSDSDSASFADGNDREKEFESAEIAAKETAKETAKEGCLEFDFEDHLNFEEY
ncbi:hypothetical protein TYRP_009644 [Tyrophagus putrescentiae]|nr:hypothetical protein TYRP_009644 [Tyrophagus putrescentiae]